MRATDFEAMNDERRRRMAAPFDLKRNIMRQFVERLDDALEIQREELLDQAFHAVTGARFARNLADAYRPEGL